MPEAGQQDISSLVVPKHLAMGLEGSEQSGSFPASHTGGLPALTQRQHLGVPEELEVVEVPQTGVSVLISTQLMMPLQTAVSL